MTRMLVAYERCGCRASALLDADDEDQATQMEVDAIYHGWTLSEEEHESIGVKRCEQHEREYQARKSGA